MPTRILYVEDEPSLAQIVSESLRSRDFDVTIARDGLEAIGLFKKETFDICVLDIMLPKMDGYSVAEQIIQENSQMPIIFVTAKTQTKDVIRGFEVGGRDYIRKPFSMEELIVRVNNLLQHGKSASEDPEKYTLGLFEFIPKRYELIRDINVISLSERESSLLTLLAAHQNDTCDRRMILKKIWGDDNYYNSRNLDVYINKLRKLLAPDPSLEIVTLKGVGYVFKV